MKLINILVLLSSTILIYESFIVPWLWIPVSVILGIISYVYIDEYILLPKRQEQ